MPDAGGYLADQFEPPSLLLFVAVEIELDSGFLRLIDGSGSVSFLGRTFTGLDPEFGVLAGFDVVTDGFGNTAPSLNVTINPPTSSAAAILASEDMQGKTVSIWLGLLTPGAGVVQDPLLVFSGQVDQGVLSVGIGSRSIALACVSIWELMFDDNQGVRLTNAYHQAAWPGELGLEYVTAVTRQLPWGADTPRPQVVADALTVKL
ncbi:MAG TPA: hypothetical protein VGG68_00725 [Caulobacteraceae bacterium]|jgi:hypothetical protein